MEDGSVEQLSLTAELYDRRARVAEAGVPHDVDPPVADGLENGSPATSQPSEALQHLRSALSARQQMVRATQGDFRDVQTDARSHAASTALRIAHMHCVEQQLQEARQVCADTLAVCSSHSGLALEVARLDLCLGHADSCEQLVRCMQHLESLPCVSFCRWFNDSVRSACTHCLTIVDL